MLSDHRHAPMRGATTADRTGELMNRSKGQIEAAVTTAITQFERDFLGRGPKEARAFIVADLVLVRLRGVLSPAEQQLSRETGGVELIKQLRSRLIEGSRDALVEIVEQTTGATVLTMHTDLSTPTGERVFVFGLDRNIEDTLQ
jgi:uncharacterized protein YbcI